VANLRLATEQDFPEMLRLGQDMHNESPRFNVHRFDRVKSESFLGAMASNPNCLSLVVESQGELVGMLLGYLASHLFCDALTANEVVVYVSPSHRGSSAAVKMLRYFEDWSIEHGAAEIVLGISTEVDSEKTRAFYQRLGFTPTGHSLIKRVSITQH